MISCKFWWRNSVFRWPCLCATSFNDDVNIIADTGTGKLLGTPGLINGFGTVDYNTGRVTFKLNTEANNIKILYKVNKFTYSVYRTFDPNKLFVRPEYIRSDTRK